MHELEQQIPFTLLADRFRLRRQLRQANEQAAAGRPNDALLERIRAAVEKSVALRAARAAGVPHIHYPADLPVSGKKDDIAAAIRENQVVVLCGETGSGKSTQLPKICLEMGRGIDGLIGHTQPRRIAARSVAGRVAQELGSQLGRDVGFKIRFTDTTGPNTYIKLMTDGILLAETQQDRFLDQYDTLIIDEAHERSLNIDFLLGYLHRLLPRRPELRLIITSATIDAERFAEHFRSARGPAPVVEVSGRTYPVEVRYRPLEIDEGDDEPDWQSGILHAVDELCDQEPGDILIFMPTERDIHELSWVLRGRTLPGDLPGRETQILPLYARLSAEEQNRVFAASVWRRIVIATNVAESSLTVPGIRYVVDPGTARISRYTPRSKVQRLPIEPISQASADQRKGRCGRVGPGVCVRLYSEQDYLSRERFTAPEIQRTNLASVVLQTHALQLGNLTDFPFLDPPRPETIRDGYHTLFELGAMDEANKLTPIGKQLARLPVDPRIGRMILAGHEENCLHEVLIIASALELQDPRERPIDKQQQADLCHKPFEHEESDFFSYLKLWDFYDKIQSELSHSKLRAACRQNFLSYNRLREWVDVYLQLREAVKQAGMHIHLRTDDYNATHRALLTGLLSNVALKSEASEYTLCGGAKGFLWPGSGILEKKPRWVIAAEVIETTRRYLRTAARIDPNWIEPLAGHLVSRSYSDAHWAGPSGSAFGYERVSLFGLVVVPRRRIPYGPIDPVISRQLMIEQGLVAGDCQLKTPFFEHNQELRLALDDMQTKTRRREYVIDDRRATEFYESRVPAECYDLSRLDRWRKQAEKENPRLLFMNEADLVPEAAADFQATDFPDRIQVRHLDVPLSYKFDPGNADDGITLTIPVEGLAQLDSRRLGWLVPGLLEEKIVALIKALPKAYRTQFIPIAVTAKKVLGSIRFGEGSFEAAVAAALTKLGATVIKPDMFAAPTLPDYLQMKIRVVGAEGKELAAGANLELLRQQVADSTPRSASTGTLRADPCWTQDGLTDWTFGDLPEHIEVKQGGLTLRGFPALVDQGQAVGLRLLDSPELAAASTRAGLRRLATLAVSKQLKSHLDWLPKLEQAALFATTLPEGRLFRKHVGELLVDRAFLTTDKIPRSAGEYVRFLTAGKARLGIAVQDVVSLVEPLMTRAHEARMALERAQAPLARYAREDAKSQFAALTMPGFLTTTPWTWLVQFPRYFQAITQRMTRLANAGLERDKRLHAQVEPLWKAYQQRQAAQQALGRHDPALETYRWMLEEFRVSLFAQELGTALPISDKRLARQWELVGN